MATDEELKAQLFDAVAARLQAAAKARPDTRVFDRKPNLFALHNGGNMLTFHEGSGRAIAAGEMRWDPKSEDRPFAFRVVRPDPNSDLLQMQPGPEGIDAIADDIITTFLKH